MNKKQAVFFRRYSALMGTPIKQLKRNWLATPVPRRHALKLRYTADLELLDNALRRKPCNPS